MACTSIDEHGGDGPAGPSADALRPTVLLQPDDDPSDGLGGKGRALAALVAKGFPVPATGVVTTAAYDAVAEGDGPTSLVSRVLGGDAAPADEVDAVFAETPIDPGIEAAIVDLAKAVGAGGLIAVRSSATVEDMHGSSFAGQYRSLLEIDSTDPHAVMTAVRQVWASLWHPAPSAYRGAFGIDETDVAMAVVMMAMVPASTAGVVFTADPGGSDGARIEAVEGLGESLVSGARTPSAWVVETGTEAEPAVEAAIPAAAQQALALALRVEDAFGVPQDVEWAADGDDVFVVQARPITVLDDGDGFDTPPDDHELTTGGIVEMVPGVLPPLRWELNRFLLEEAFRSVLDSLGILRGLDAEDHRFVRRVRGRAAIDFDQLRAAASGIPGAVVELERQYFGASDPEGSPELAAAPKSGRVRRWWAALQRDLRALRTRRLVIDGADVLINVVGRLRSRRPVLTGKQDVELLAYGRRLVDLAARGLAAELGVAATAAAAYGRLEDRLVRHLGADEGAAAAQSLAVAGGIVSRDASASAAVFAGPTWSERGAEPPGGTAESSGHRSRLVDIERAITSLPGWRRRRILTGQFVDVRIHVVRRSVTDLVEQLRRREEAKAAVLELGGELRRVHLELGGRLVDRGLLDRPTDIELLSTTELAAACHGTLEIGRDVLRRRRNWVSRYEAQGALPTRFSGTPDREPAPLPEGDIVRGWGASPGRVRAVARIMRDPDDPLEPGEIIVAETTDPSWSPTFVRAGGLIVERGGPLSHAAILARELGLPCVMNVEAALGRLDGRLVALDGDEGVIVIEDGEEDGP